MDKKNGVSRRRYCRPLALLIACVVLMEASFAIFGEPKLTLKTRADASRYSENLQRFSEKENNGDDSTIFDDDALIDSQYDNIAEKTDPTLDVTSESENACYYAIRYETEAKEAFRKEEENSMYEMPSDEELLLMGKVIFAEAGSSSFLEQRGVAAVILCRSKEWNKSIEEVIFQRGQFSVVHGKKVIYSGGVVPDELAMLMYPAIYEAVKGGGGAITTNLTEQAKSKGISVKKYGGEPLYFFGNRYCNVSAKNKYPVGGTTFYTRHKTP